jgi:predicted porin
LTLQASVGASVNDSANDSVSAVTPDIDIRLHKAFKRGSGMLGYSRSVGASEGFGGASEGQSFTASGTYQHTEVWRSSASATFSERLSDAARTADTHRLTVRYDTSYPLGRRLRLKAGYLFSREKISNYRRFAGEVTNNQVFVGLRYGADIL